jgi:predicted nucleic acid-binding protein
MSRLLFFDSSALVKRYLFEAGSNAVNALFYDQSVRLIISTLALAEVSSAIVRRLSREQSTLLLDDFDADAKNVFAIAPLNDDVALAAVDLVRRRRIRGCDAIQLAVALHIASALSDDAEETVGLEFVCADDTLNTAAEAEGLRTLDPSDSES